MMALYTVTLTKPTVSEVGVADGVTGSGVGKGTAERSDGCCCGRVPDRLTVKGGAARSQSTA